MSLPNINPKTGIRYGVISGNSLHPEVLDELYCLASSKVSAAAEEVRRAELISELTDAVQEILPNVALGGQDMAALVDLQVEWEQNNGHFDNDEPSADIEYEGYQLSYSYLGGAPLIFVLEGPFITAVNRLCSPCVPGAGDLDSGMDWENGMYQCYGVPSRWLDKEAE